MKILSLIVLLVLVSIVCRGAGVTVSSLNGVATNLTEWNSVTNRAVAQPSGTDTNVLAIGSDGKEFAIPFADFGGGSGGSGTLTNGFYTNSGPDTVVIDDNLLLNTNSFGGGTATLPAGVLTNFDTRSWTNSKSSGVSVSIGSSGQTIFNADGSANSASGGLMWDASGDETANALSVTFGATIGSALSWGGVGTGNGSGITALNASALATGTAPTARLGSGSASSTTFLRGDQTWATVSSGGITSLTGDVTASGTGSVTATVKGINGTILSTLQSGVMLNTFGTGVPATVSDWVSLAAQLTLLIPPASLGSGSSGALKFLGSDQVYHAVSSGGTPFTIQTNLAGSISFGYILTDTNINTSTSRAIAVGDMNGDGLPDVVVNQNAALVVYTNSGKGQFFVQASTTAITSVAGGVALSDVNGDGRLDAIIESSGGSYIAVFTNNGAGIMTQLGGNYTSSSTSWIVAGDLNGDNKPDFIVGGSGLVTQMWTNDGVGNFADMTNWNAAYDSVYPWAITNFTAAGKEDVVMGLIKAAGKGLQVFTNSGTGLFGPYYTNLNILADGYVAAGDFDENGTNDIVLWQGSAGANALYFMTNNGTGFGGYYTNAVNGAGGAAGGLVVADWNHDGAPDVAVACVGTPLLTVVTNAAGVGGFAISQTFPLLSSFMLNGLTVGDFNGDGLPDPAYVSGANGAYIDVDTAIFSGTFSGNGQFITNLNISVVYNAGAVTPANAWQTNNVNGGIFTVNTNYLGYTANGQRFVNGTVMTANTTATATFNTSGFSETIYNTSATTLGTLAITLSTSAVPGMINRYATHGICSVVTVTGTVSIGSAVTALTADSTVAWQALTASTWARIQ